MTRADLARATGLARSTVAQRVDTLIVEGLVHDLPVAASPRGRPPAVPGLQSRRRRRPRRRPRSHALAGRGERSRRSSSRRTGGTSISISVGRRPRMARRALHGARCRRRRSRDDVRGIGVGSLARSSSQAAAREPAPIILPGWTTPIPMVCRPVPPPRCWSTTTSASWPAASIGCIGGTARRSACLGLNGSGKSSLLRIIAGVDKDFNGRDTSRPATPSATSNRSRSSTRRRPSARSSRRRSQRRSILLKEFDEINAKFADPMDDDEMDKLLERQGEVQEKLDARTRGTWTRSSRWRWTRCAARRPRRR